MRECDCPAWVIRCAHWGGRKLWLVGPQEQCCGAGDDYDYAVISAETVGPCPVRGTPQAHVNLSARYYVGDDLSAAEDAFYAAHES